MYVIEARGKSAKGDTGMNAKELIELVNVEKARNWKNSNLYAETKEMLEKIVEHYEKCEECRQAFDDTEYDEEELIDMEPYLDESDGIEDWICDEA